MDISNNIRKNNCRFYPIYRAISVDFLFYYSVYFLFLSYKGISASDIVLLGSFGALAKCITLIPITMLLDKIGNKRAIIIANISNLISVISLIAFNDYLFIALSQIFVGFSSGVKSVAEPSLLNDSLVSNKKRGAIFSKLDGRGMAGYYVLNALASIISGFLFNINPYIPMLICVFFIIVSIVLAALFKEIKTKKQNFSKTYLRDFGKTFKHILNSNRLKGLILFSGIMWGIFSVIDTYQVSLFYELKISPTYIGIIIALLNISAAISSAKQNTFHNRFRNHSLAVLGISVTLVMIFVGVTALIEMPALLVGVVVFIFLCISSTDLGIYNVLTKRYLGNFVESNVSSKIYAIEQIATNIGKMIICLLGSLILRFTSTSVSFIILGTLLFALIILVLRYMKTRVGLKPEEYEGEKLIRISK